MGFFHASVVRYVHIKKHTHEIVNLASTAYGDTRVRFFFFFFKYTTQKTASRNDKSVMNGVKVWIEIDTIKFSFSL